MKRAIALAAVASIGLAGCGAGQPDPAPTVTATETVTASPDSDTAVEFEAATDDWLDEALAEHLIDLRSWFIEYRDEDCHAGEPECYDTFLRGLPKMEAYDEFLKDTYDDRPDYVPGLYGGDVARAARSMDSWQHACPDADDCYDRGLEVGSDIFNIITETNEWGE